MILPFYKNKKVLITGHTGFKGSWLCYALQTAGAKILGIALEPSTTPSLCNLISPSEKIVSVIADIRDAPRVKQVVRDFQPEIVFHLAAQPIVLAGYENPSLTYETNVMGSVNILEAIRECPSVMSFVNVTTDKVYHNQEWQWGYREIDALGGNDPYSNSKSCSELVTDTYRKSFFSERSTALSTCRAGNVIGGGDFSPNRIVPDCINAAIANTPILVRNPLHVRPYQHVLESLSAYMQLAAMQYSDKEKYEGAYNIGPNESDCVSTGELASLFCELWGENVTWRTGEESQAGKESRILKLDSSKIRSILGWAPHWDVRKAMAMTISWSKAYVADQNIDKVMRQQILEYFSGIKKG